AIATDCKIVTRCVVRHT
ncbi:aromatic amino acid lyase family protein, partial [Vibrio parahaemolyticus VPTS-2010]